MACTAETKQSDADDLRKQAREIEVRAAFVSDEHGGAEMDKKARELRKQAQEIEKCLPLE
jgi:hypothetical protein